MTNLSIYIIHSASAHSAGPWEVLPKGGVVLSCPCSSFDNFYQKQKNGTEFDHKWEQSGPGGGGRGTRKSTKNTKRKREELK